jgi:hypothetical protein
MLAGSECYRRGLRINEKISSERLAVSPQCEQRLIERWKSRFLLLPFSFISLAALPVKMAEEIFPEQDLFPEGSLVFLLAGPTKTKRGPRLPNAFFWTGLRSSSKDISLNIIAKCKMSNVNCKVLRTLLF